ncbi:MAG: hypothetical protein V8T00_08345 [Oscillospiraceae bacterium]
MKNTVTILRERLFSIIRRLGEEPERYARKPGRDFTRKRMLTPDVLIYLVLTMDEKSVWKGLLRHFRKRTDTPSRWPLCSSGRSCLHRRLKIVSPLLGSSASAKEVPELSAAEQYGYSSLQPSGIAQNFLYKSLLFNYAVLPNKAD